MKIKAPTSEIDWPISYPLDAGETIATSTWTVSPAETGGIAVKAGSSSIALGIVSCLLTGGIFRHVYEVTNTAVTSSGRTLAATLGFRVGPVEPS